MVLTHGLDLCFPSTQYHTHKFSSNFTARVELVECLAMTLWKTLAMSLVILVVPIFLRSLYNYANFVILLSC